VIKRVLQYLVLVIAVVALPLACKRTETAVQGDGTQTIKPAATQSAETSTADMTQTIEFQEETARSEAEGGVLSNSSTSGTGATTTTDLPPVTGTGTSTSPTTATTRTQ
jgi:hypothetical protein